MQTKLSDVMSPERVSTLQKAWDETKSADKWSSVEAAMTIAIEDFDYDMSELCGLEQLAIGEAYETALRECQGKVTDRVRMAVARALIATLLTPACTCHAN
jgi:hypothetical protein